MNRIMRKVYLFSQKIPLINLIARKAAERIRSRKLQQLQGVDGVLITTQELVTRIALLEHQITVLTALAREKNSS